MNLTRVGNAAHVLGPIITSYLLERPSQLKQCCPCPGPPNRRWMKNSTLFGDSYNPRCICDGKGFCDWSRDLGQFLTSRCTCTRCCVYHPHLNWEEAVWRTIVRQFFEHMTPPILFAFVRISRSRPQMRTDPQTMDEVRSIIYEAVACKHKYYHRGGFSPYQLVIRKNPRLPRALLSDGAMGMDGVPPLRGVVAP